MRTMSEPHSPTPGAAGIQKMSAEAGIVARENGAHHHQVKISRDAGSTSDDSLLDTIRGWLRLLRRSKGSETVREAL